MQGNDPSDGRKRIDVTFLKKREVIPIRINLTCLTILYNSISKVLHSISYLLCGYSFCQCFQPLLQTELTQGGPTTIIMNLTALATDE